MSVLWSAAELRAATGAPPRTPFAATGASIDSRTLRPGDLFVALVGENGDGHSFVADALARGAAGAMVHRLPDRVPDDAPLLPVADTLDGLRALAVFARARFRGRLAAVTGSVGKTTTKEMLRVVLSATGKSWAAEASHNNHWGVPLTLARLPADARFCVAEIGMNHAGEIAPLSRLARPHAALITAVERAHVGHLGSIEAIADEKAAVFAGLEPDGIAILPGDSAMLGRLTARTGGVRTLLFGSQPGLDAYLQDAASDALGTTVLADIRGTAVQIRLAAPGRHMAMNAVAALATAAALGCDPAVGAQALNGFAPVAGRGMQRQIALPDGQAVLLDESYNASAVSVRAALSVLALLPASRRIVVLGDMLELGDEGPAEHAGLAPDIAAGADLLFTCGKLMRGLHDAVPAALRAGHAADAESLAPIVADAIRPGDAVLVKGSLGSRMKHVVRAIEARGAG